MQNHNDNDLNHPSISKEFIWVWMIMLIIIATYLRIEGVNEYHYSEDELLHVGISGGKSLKQVLQFSLYEAHPPLGHIIRYYWMKISDEIWFVRSLSLLFGIALIPLYYRIGKLLGGEFAGMCCAALIAFSYGCIIQSYVARNYTILLFLLSAGLYYYLCWSISHSFRSLLLYTAFAILGCLTHFFCIFFVLPIVVYEMMSLRMKAAGKAHAVQWIIVNVTIAAIAVCTYGVWCHTLILSHAYSRCPFSPAVMLYRTLYYPLSASSYLFPCAATLYLVAILLPLALEMHNRYLHSLFSFTCIAVAITVILIITIHYSSTGSRHDFWLIPFVIPLAGVIIAGGGEFICSKLGKIYPLPWMHVIACILLIAGILAYDPGRRFSDVTEYEAKTQDVNSLIHYLSALDDKTVIVAERDEAFRIKNIYPFLGDNPSTGESMAVMIPYYNTHLLFNPYYRRMRTRDILFSTMESASKNKMLDGINTLVFMHAYPVASLIACAKLDKAVIAFSSFAHDNLTAEEIFSNPTILLTVSKKDLFEQVMSPSGKAHECLKENPEMEKQVEPLPPITQGRKEE